LKLYRPRFLIVNDRLWIYAMNHNDLADKGRALFAALTAAHITARLRTVCCPLVRRDRRCLRFNKRGV